MSLIEFNSFIFGAIAGFILAIIPVRHFMKVFQDRVEKQAQEAYAKLQDNCFKLMKDTTELYRGHLLQVIATQGQTVSWSISESVAKMNLADGTKTGFTDEELEKMNEEIRRG